MAYLSALWQGFITNIPVQLISKPLTIEWLKISEAPISQWDSSVSRLKKIYRFYNEEARKYYYVGLNNKIRLSVAAEREIGVKALELAKKYGENISSVPKNERDTGFSTASARDTLRDLLNIVIQGFLLYFYYVIVFKPHKSNLAISDFPRGVSYCCLLNIISVVGTLSFLQTRGIPMVFILMPVFIPIVLLFYLMLLGLLFLQNKALMQRKPSARTIQICFSIFQLLSGCAGFFLKFDIYGHIGRQVFGGFLLTQAVLHGIALYFLFFNFYDVSDGSSAA